MSVIFAAFPFKGRVPDEYASALRREVTSQIVARLECEGVGEYSGGASADGEYLVYFAVANLAKGLDAARSAAASIGMSNLEVAPVVFPDRSMEVQL